MRETTTGVGDEGLRFARKLSFALIMISLLTSFAILALVAVGSITRSHSRLDLVETLGLTELALQPSGRPPRIVRQPTVDLSFSPFIPRDPSTVEEGP